MKEANTESSHKCELQWILVACPTYTCSQLLPHPQAATNRFHPPRTAFFLQNYHLFIKLGKLYSELHENNGKAAQLPDVLHLPTEECQNWHWKVVDAESLKTDRLWSFCFSNFLNFSGTSFHTQLAQLHPCRKERTRQRRRGRLQTF